MDWLAQGSKAILCAVSASLQALTWAAVMPTVEPPSWPSRRTSCRAYGRPTCRGTIRHGLRRVRSPVRPRLTLGQYWLIMDSAADAVTLLPSQALRSARPHNLATLLQVVIARLLSLMRDPDFPVARPGVRALHRAALDQRPLFARFTASSASGEPDLAREALNCVRVLTRVLPVLFERGVEDDPLGAIEHDLFWTPQRRTASSAAESNGEDQFVLGEEEDAEESARASESASSVPAGDLPCLGDDLCGSRASERR